MAEIRVPISVGELVDKITILEIKREKIGDRVALANVKKELDLLQRIFDESELPHADIAPLKEGLSSVNQELWSIEDRIRQKEASQQFDGRFIELARAVYLTNDRRARLKRRINKLSGSLLVEEKSYADYG